VAKRPDTRLRQPEFVDDAAEQDKRAAFLGWIWEHSRYMEISFEGRKAPPGNEKPRNP
jgi:hypothetical protein